MSTTSGRSRSDIGRANLAKSKRAEQAVTGYLRAHGWPSAERTVRTGYAVEGRTSRDRGDIETPGLVWQVKSVEERKHHLVPAWLAETEQQRQAAGADYGLLVVKRAGHGFPGSWWAHLYLHDLHRLLAGTSPLVAVGLQSVRLELAGLVRVLSLAGYGTPTQFQEAS